MREPNPARPESSRSAPARSAPARSDEPPRSDPAQSEGVRPEPGQPNGAPPAADALLAFRGTSAALAAVRSGLEFLAAADAGSLPDAELADCLKGLELAAAAHTAARARILAAFSARGVFEDDGARSARSWLVWQTRTT
jgi:hypothetical protein